MNERLLALSVTCACAVLSAVGMVAARRLVRCAGLLLVHSLALAATYLLLSAEFLAMGQVVVYTGAIVVLFLFVVLLLPQGGREVSVTRGRLVMAALGGAVMLTALLAAVCGAMVSPPDAAAAPDLSTVAVAHALFGPQLVPFELTALLLLVAIVGAVGLWQRERGEARP